MLNFKPRLLHAAMLLALPTLLAGYPHEDAFARKANLLADIVGAKSNELIGGANNNTAGPLQIQGNRVLNLTQPAIWLAQSHIQLLNDPFPNSVVKYTGDFDPDLKFAEDKLNKYLGTTDEKMLKLAGGKDTLMKLELPQAQGFLPPKVQCFIRPRVKCSSDPQVKATLYDKNGFSVWKGTATKPTAGPTSFEYLPGQVTHNLDSSFRLMLPGEHLATGTQLEIVIEDPRRAGRNSWRKKFALNIGAPTVLPVTMFDFRVLENNGKTLPTEAMLELGRKLLIKELNLQRVEVNMDEAVFLPYVVVEDEVKKTLTPHIRATSFKNWQEQAQNISGITMKPENPRGVDHSQTILTALLHAGGQMYISAYHGNFNDGTSGNFDGRGNSIMVSSSINASVSDAKGVFAHEFSHNLDLYHWHEKNNQHQYYADKPYPYEGAMFGISPPTADGNKTHNGPNWLYNPPTDGKPFGEAIPPFKVVDQNKIYKRVISTARAQDDKLGSEQIGVFSDFDNRVSQHWLESVLRVYNTKTSKWSTWDQAAGSYSKQVGGTPGVNLPLKPEPESVLSLVFATSVVNKAANLAYRPIGPYKSGIRFLYDPQDSAQRTSAVTNGYCPAATLPSGGGCDYSVRVIQNGKAHVYMLPIDDESDNGKRTNVTKMADEAVKHIAINVPESDGAVQTITIYKTPNIERATGSVNIQSAEVLSTRTF